MSFASATPITETPGHRDTPGLVETYLRMIEDQNRRMAVYEAALREGRDHLAQIPAQIIDLQTRLAAEIDPDIADILLAKLEEAQEEQEATQRHIAKVEARWFDRQLEIQSNVQRLSKKLEGLGHVVS